MDLMNVMKEVIGREEAHNLQEVVFTGAGLWGALAKVAALRMCLEEDPLEGLTMKSGSSDPSWGVEVVLYTFGAPHIKVERNNRKHIQLHHHCSSQSRSWRLQGDPMPLMLSEHSHAIVAHYTKRRGLCCRRRGNGPRKGSYLYTYLGVQHHTSHHFKSV